MIYTGIDVTRHVKGNMNRFKVVSGPPSGLADNMARMVPPLDQSKESDPVDISLAI